LILCCVFAFTGVPCVARAADPWLFVNDVHYDRGSHVRAPITYGGDTNPALLASALDEMRRVSPNPPVIVMAGDFLPHHFTNDSAVARMVELANRFGRAFPHAQFVMALGNEDSSCGDYAVAPNSAFLREVAHAWAPLVNRHGAAPDFERTFSHDGFYEAKLPVPGLRAVVVDDAFWSVFYRDGCGGRGNPTPGTFGELDRALRPRENERRWLVMHIPPGIDASSTVRRTYKLAIVPFLRPSPRDELLRLIADPARRVELVVTGHIHRFAFRIADRPNAAPIPVLVSPAISPIYGNAPSFLTADVSSDGTIRNIEEHSFVDRTWRDIGGLGTLGVSEFSGPALENLQHRLERDEHLRETFATLYVGGSGYREINEHNWRSFWCAATEFNSTAFRDCLDEGGFSFLTRRGVFVVGGAIVAALLVAGLIATLIIYVLRRRKRRAR
jgi:sphingomyelin phosphodiesterase acid-like 3